MQHFAERTIDQEFCTWNQLVLPDFLFAQFCQYCDSQTESKKWTAKIFQMSISKYLSLKANSRDRSNNVNVRYYDLGDSADKFIENLKEKKLYSHF